MTSASSAWRSARHGRTHENFQRTPESMSLIRDIRPQDNAPPSFGIRKTELFPAGAGMNWPAAAGWDFPGGKGRRRHGFVLTRGAGSRQACSRPHAGPLVPRRRYTLIRRADQLISAFQTALQHRSDDARLEAGLFRPGTGRADDRARRSLSRGRQGSGIAPLAGTFGRRGGSRHGQGLAGGVRRRRAGQGHHSRARPVRAAIVPHEKKGSHRCTLASVPSPPPPVMTEHRAPGPCVRLVSRDEPAGPPWAQAAR